MPRRRLRTFTLWTGTTLCVLIAAAFVVSVNRDSIAGGFGEPVRADRVDPRHPNLVG